MSSQYVLARLAGLPSDLLGDCAIVLAMRHEDPRICLGAMKIRDSENEL
jgi:hypothetical protein